MVGFEPTTFCSQSRHATKLRYIPCKITLSSILEKKYICGYVPIDFYAPIFLGSTRNNNNYNNCKEFIINKNEKDKLSKKNNSSYITKYQDISWVNRELIIYDI